MTSDSGLTWTQQQKIAAADGASNDWFGEKVSVADNLLAIAAAQDDDKGSNSGMLINRPFCFSFLFAVCTSLPLLVFTSVCRVGVYFLHF